MSELVRHVRWMVEDATFELALFDVKAKGWADRPAVGYRMTYQCGETHICWDQSDSTHFTADAGDGLGSDRTISVLLIKLFGELAEVFVGEMPPQSFLQRAVVKQYGETLVDQAIATHGGDPPPWDDVPLVKKSLDDDEEQLVVIDHSVEYSPPGVVSTELVSMKEDPEWLAQVHIAKGRQRAAEGNNGDCVVRTNSIVQEKK